MYHRRLVQACFFDDTGSLALGNLGVPITLCYCRHKIPHVGGHCERLVFLRFRRQISMMFRVGARQFERGGVSNFVMWRGGSQPVVGLGEA